MSTLLAGKFTKLDPARRLAFGWASVVSENGQDLVDLQDDVIDMPSLEDAVYSYMEDSRAAGEMHQQMGIGKVVESFMATTEKLAALGMASVRTGWVVGVRVNEEVWPKVQSGEYGGFSIGGSGTREEVAA